MNNQTKYKSTISCFSDYKVIFQHTKLLFLFLLLETSVQGQSVCGLPFGSNNPYASSLDSTSIWLSDLNICWISDHLRRSKIENKTGNTITYDFSDVDPKLLEYGTKANANAWFIINTESKYPFLDGREIGTSNKYIAGGDTSYFYYNKFLDTLVKYVNGKVPSWKTKYWSVDNEHSSLYVPAFCSGAVDTICGDSAAQEYAHLVENTWNTIKGIDVSAKIVYGGIAGGTSKDEYNYYYIPSLIKLKALSSNGYFDFFDFHDFNTYKNYKTNSIDKGVTYFTNLLQNIGFSNKSIIMKAGATHTGIDSCASNKRLHEYQTEQQQAEYLIKRFIWNIANGAKLILYGDIREDTTLHDIFSQNGLMYNGIPDLSYCNSTTCDTSFFKPCPDPGDGIKKLSYYTFKLLSNKLKNCDFNTIDTVNNGNGNVYVYKLLDTIISEPIWVSWWDYWNDTTSTTKNTAIKIGNSSWFTANITAAIPEFSSGSQLSPSGYPTFFSDTVMNIINDTLFLSLGQSPVYIQKGLFTGIINNKRTKKTIKIFPQPFSTQTTLLTTNQLKSATLTVDNCFGQTVKQITPITLRAGQTVVFSRDNLASGLYFIHLTEDNTVIAVDKLVITD